MKCPNCGTTCKSSQQVWQERMRANGRCIGCGRPKSPKDQPHDRCKTCRVKASARSKAAYRRKHPALTA